jgi:beta-glucosidase
LLKNSGVLPLHNPRRIAVIGRAAREAYIQGSGSSHINPTQVDEPYAELVRLADGAELTYADGYPPDETFDQALIDAACEDARRADVALLYISLPATKESEGFDRPDLDLTRQQVALIKAVAVVQPQVVVILNNGAPVVMDAWIDSAAAVLEAWMMGQAGGGAIADLLFGRVNPSGRLAETFPLRLADTPAYIHYPGENGAVRYGEGLYVGYRYYDAKAAPVQFPFGHGLSYTTFEYNQPRLSAASFKDVDGVTVSVDVTNTGKLAGKEVVQVYVHDRQCSLARPPKELKGFAKVDLKPGETKTVSVDLDFRAFAFYHPAYQQWITEDGEYDLLIGASSADIRCALSVTLQSSLQLPSLLTHDSSLRQWIADPRGMDLLQPFFEQLLAQMQATFMEDAAHVHMAVSDFLLDMPLPSMLYFTGADLPKSPDEIVDDLLAQVRDQLGG